MLNFFWQFTFSNPLFKVGRPYQRIRCIRQLSTSENNIAETAHHSVVPNRARIPAQSRWCLCHKLHRSRYPEKKTRKIIHSYQFLSNDISGIKVKQMVKNKNEYIITWYRKIACYGNQCMLAYNAFQELCTHFALCCVASIFVSSGRFY